MTDTPLHIYEKQYEIMMAKPMSERILLGFETIDTTRQWIENSIKKDNPAISEIDLAIAVFLRYYRIEFSEIQVESIIKSLRAYHDLL